MKDLDKIKRNVKRLIDGGAGRDKIEMYLSHEGVTREQIRNHKAPGMLSKAGQFLSEAGSAVHEAVVGKQDPRFENVPDFANVDFNNFDPEKMPATGMAKMFGQTDEQFADIIENNLKQSGRFVARQKDANGYDVFTFKDDLGEEQQAYANRPGLDWQDVDRGITSSIPYLATATGAGRLLKSAGLLAKATGQGLTAAATSAGSDIVAKNLGSKQNLGTGGIDPVKAVVTGGATGLMEGLTPLAVEAFRKIFRSHQYVDVDGNLTKAGRDKVKDLGVDPDQITPEVALDLKQDLTKAASKAELGAKVRTDEFELLTSKGQRTKDPDIISTEQGMRKGTFGRDASQVMRNFDEAQEKSIREAALGKVGGKIDPDASGGEMSTDLADIGGQIRSGLQEGLKESQKKERAHWEGLGYLDATDDAKKKIPKFVQKKLEDLNTMVDNQLHPFSTKALNDLHAYSKGEALNKPHAILGEEFGVTSIRHMQRRLLAAVNSAEKDDKKIAGEIYGAFHNWISGIADNGLLGGNAVAAARLKTARAFTAQERALFEPTNKMGKKTPAAEILRKVMDDNIETPEGIISMLFSDSGTKRKPKAGVAQAIRHMMIVVRRAEQAGVEEIAQMGSGLRLAYWTSLVTNKRGNMVSPKIMRNNIETALTNQRSVMRELYSEEELKLMRRFAKAVDDATWEDPFPSGTAYGVEAFKRQKSGKSGVAGVAKNVAAAKQKKAVFSDKNFMMARIYELLRENIVRLAGGSADRSARRQAADLTAQTIDTRLLKSYPYLSGPAGGAAGSYYADR